MVLTSKLKASVAIVLGGHVGHGNSSRLNSQQGEWHAMYYRGTDSAVLSCRVPVTACQGQIEVKRELFSVAF